MSEQERFYVERFYIDEGNGDAECDRRRIGSGETWPEIIKLINENAEGVRDVIDKTYIDGAEDYVPGRVFIWEIIDEAGRRMPLGRLSGWKA